MIDHGTVAAALGLTTGMMLAALLYVLCGGVWLLLPETLQRRLLTDQRRR